MALGLVPMLDVLARPASAPAVAIDRRARWRELGRMTFTIPDGPRIDELVFVGPGRTA